MSDYIQAGALRKCWCGSRPSTYGNNEGWQCYCYGCKEETAVLPTEQDAYRAWQNHETIIPERDIIKLRAEVERLNGIIIRYQLTKKALANHTAHCDVCEINDYCEVGDRLIKDHIIAKLDLDEGGEG